MFPMKAMRCSMPPRTAPVHMIGGLDVTFDANVTS
jgi:hypothetical protein